MDGETPNSAVEAIFNAAVELAGPQRAEYLAHACGKDAALRQQVEALLQIHEAPEGFLPEQPGADAAARAGSVAAGAGVGPTEHLGDLIGRYKLLEKLGEGGFGVVYVAEQKEPVKRQVALKVIKLGMDTRQVVGRFEIERQALALMDHPNIAKVLDAGATDAGRPYFVMELVRGVPLTHYCDQHNLAPAQRLALFTQVCRAIQHAHQKGIIHRDIKPSNILVTIQDGVAVPKVIDFGIAKATAGELTDKTVFTQFQQFIGTPAYMSPEQTEPSGLNIDTRSDIYALGVLLYELLVGKTPFDTKELLRAGLDQMRRTIREEEPVRPSTRLGGLDGGELTTTARRRGTEPRRLISLLRGDLDWVAMKCLEKDRTRRYETANGLAMDIERYLAQEPVVARPPSGVYRLQKLIRRNKLVFAAGGAVTAALVVGVVISTWQAVRARKAQANEARERQHAQTEAAKSQQVARLLKEMLQGAGPSKALGRDTTMLHEILDRTAERVSKELTNQPLVQLDLYETLVQTYWDLGLYKEMEAIARSGVQVARTSFGQECREVLSPLNALGLAQWGLTHFEQAEASEREAVELRRKLGGPEDMDLAGTLNSFGLVLEAEGKLGEAETAYREALRVLRKLNGNEHPDVAMALYNLGNVLTGENKLDEAIATEREVLALRRKLLGNEHPDVAMALNTLAALVGMQGNMQESEQMLREVVAIQRKVFGGEHRHLALGLYNLANVLRLEGKLPEAESDLRESLAMVRKLLGEDNADFPSTLNGLAAVLRDEGKLAEAEAVARQAWTTNQKLLGSNHPEVTKSFATLISIERAAGKLAEAEALCQQQVAEFRAHPPPDQVRLAEALSQLASTLLDEKKFAEAEPAARECLSIREKLTPDDWRTFNLRSLVGACLLGQQKYADAEPFLLSGYEGLKQREAKITVESKARLKEALQRLVQLAVANNQTVQAVEWKQKLADFELAETNKPSSSAVPAKPPP